MMLRLFDCIEQERTDAREQYRRNHNMDFRAPSAVFAILDIADDGGYRMKPEFSQNTGS
jgi:hypothetical protein